MKIPIWEASLAGHPDRKVANYVVNGLRSIGYDYASTIGSAMEMVSIVDENLGQEVVAKRLLGPLT